MAKSPRTRWNEDEDEFGPLPTYMELAMAAAAATPHEAPRSSAKSLLPRLSAIEKMVAIGIVCLAFYGMALIGCGLFLKVEAKRTGFVTQQMMSAELQYADFDIRITPVG